jgi:hypothetical protein
MSIKRDRDMYVKGYTDGWRDGIEFKEKRDSTEKAILEKCKQ